MVKLANTSRYILLAEDNPADIELVREALLDRAVACELRVVWDGEEAVKFIETIDRDSTLVCPELLLLDLHLPKRGGEEILQCLRASERCGKTPVVIMTSSAPRGDIQKATRSAGCRYFHKPNTLEQFMQLGDVVLDMLGPGDIAAAVE